MEQKQQRRPRDASEEAACLSAEDLAGDGRLLRRELGRSRDILGRSTGAFAAELRVRFRASLPGRTFAEGITCLSLGAATSSSPSSPSLPCSSADAANTLPGTVSAAALGDLREGERVALRLHPALLQQWIRDGNSGTSKSAGAQASTAGGFEWVDDDRPSAGSAVSQRACTAAGALAAGTPWSSGGFDWVEDSDFYELEIEVLCRGPALLSPECHLDVVGGPPLPRLGLGLYEVDPRDAYNATLEALRIGYRLVDTASMYRNEGAVGRALRESGIPRCQVVVVSKVNVPDHGYQEALAAVERSVAKLGLGYVDLMLIHSPIGGRLLETWDALLEARRRGWARQVGVSNFGEVHLRRLEACGRGRPAVNQIEVSPFNQERALRSFCRRRGIVVMGYAPLTRGARLDDQRLRQVASKHSRSPAQILVRWALEQGLVSIPKSTRSERLREHFDVFGFCLDELDYALLDTCDEGLHTCWNCLQTPWNG
eukprot:TRINITY_DN57634_c0_g1_i1.p1 TRINITY_DN57634_c0_g1~~TRINITY_DN57634_c0_g1_i1.p1  ORF type:complete len:485 (-),score=98.51 TRINITY_DN57634_c0_g1_i1:102-1556(-)